MYLHIGDGKGILSRDIIAVFDLKTTVFSSVPTTNNTSKSAVLINEKGNSKFLYSTVSVSTIRDRAKCFLFDEERK